MIGEIFGSWLVIGEAEPSKWRERLFLCRCVCGLIKTVAYFSLIKGRSRQCRGCADKSKPCENIDGKTFGYWTAIKEIKRVNRHRYFLCVCLCGNTSTVTFVDLKHGRSTKCPSCATTLHYKIIKEGR